MPVDRCLLECLPILRALAADEGPVNICRKTAFVAAAYEDSKVLAFYFDDEDQPWNGVRRSVIQALDLGNMVPLTRRKFARECCVEC